MPQTNYAIASRLRPNGGTEAPTDRMMLKQPPAALTLWTRTERIFGEIASFQALEIDSLNCYIYVISG